MKQSIAIIGLVASISLMGCATTKKNSNSAKNCFHRLNAAHAFLLKQPQKANMTHLLLREIGPLNSPSASCHNLPEFTQAWHQVTQQAYLTALQSGQPTTRAAIMSQKYGR